MLRESHQIRTWLAENPHVHDNERIIHLARLWDLESTTPLSRRTAFQDLNASAFFHALPCYCPKCDPRKVCK